MIFTFQAGQTGRRIITALGPTDPYFSNVSLLCHMEGTNGGASFTDSSSYAHTLAVGTGTTNSNTQVKFGSTSMFITGTDAGGVGYTTAVSEFGFGTGDYTVEAWCYATNVSSRLNMIFDNRLSSATGIALFIGGGAFSVASGSIGISSNSAILATATGVTANTWLHIAIARASNTLKGFINGTQAFSITDSRTYASSAGMYVGRDISATALQGFGGYLDDLRVTKGVARYTANFTPPTAAFPDH